jgi:putative flavoprotein involved in K+ transport
MKDVTCVVIGGGQSGLAMSRCLTDRGIDHLVFERGRIAERWRSERWDSLRLLTPNWQSRLPGFGYDGPDPDGFMTMPEVVRFFERYATSFGAPVREGISVTSVTRDGCGFRIDTDRGAWRARTVVVATGHSDRPFVPPMASRMPPEVAQIVPSHYRRPSDLREGGVLVVGASASGIQLADEIHRSGRPVTIAVGRHTRVPRIYRGHDVLWWLDQMGLFDETLDRMYDATISKEQPSLQLVGDPRRLTLDLNSLADLGVRVVGRLLDVKSGEAWFNDDLVATTAAADIKLASLLRRIDAFIVRDGRTVEPAPEFRPHCLRFANAETHLPLTANGIRTVIWATGFTRAYPWLRLPVLTAHGEIHHQGGVTGEPGLYVLGLHFLRRRKSAFIDGVGDDARVLATHLAGYLAEACSAVA